MQWEPELGCRLSLTPPTGWDMIFQSSASASGGAPAVWPHRGEVRLLCPSHTFPATPGREGGQSHTHCPVAAPHSAH